MPGPRDRAQPFPGTMDMGFYIERTAGERIRKFLWYVFVMTLIASFL